MWLWRMHSYKAERANKFIVYFQNFSNTYDTIENLKEKYDAALINDKIIGLSIATRPDCINEEIAKLIREKFDLTPNGIIKYLELKKPIYSSTTNYGHFGKDGLSWERIIEI